MKISQEQLEAIASLARLNLTDKEKERLVYEMEEIIEFADQLAEIDTAEVEPTAYPIPIKNVFRQDRVEKSFDREDMLKNAPSCENGYIKVPKVIE